MHLQKKLKIFYSPVETRRKRSDVGISTNLSNLFFLPLQKKKKNSGLFGQATEEALHSQVGFQDVEERHFWINFNNSLAFH